jgi:hypothetical protein
MRDDDNAASGGLGAAQQAVSPVGDAYFLRAARAFTRSRAMGSPPETYVLCSQRWHDVKSTTSPSVIVMLIRVTAVLVQALQRADI